MKTLLFNVSPRTDGNTAALISALSSQLRGSVMKVDAYDAGIGPCNDCRACRTAPGCTQQDGMQAVYGAIQDSDCIVIASPIYFSELTGPLLSIMSRLQTFWCARVLRGEQPIVKPKRGGILLAGGGDGSAARAMETAACLLRQMNAQVVGSACSLKTDALPAGQDEAALRATADLARRLNGE